MLTWTRESRLRCRASTGLDTGSLEPAAVSSELLEGLPPGLKFYVYTIKNAFQLGSNSSLKMRSQAEKESQKETQHL